MERDSLRNMLYSLARFGLFILINLFGIVIGKTAILGVMGTFFPKLKLYDNTQFLSIISWILPMVLLIALFADDAKRHTAYGRYNPILVSITTILSAAIYYVPAIVIGYIKDPRVIDAMKQIYFTHYWISYICGDNVEIYGLLGCALTAIICIVSYLIARKIYLRKFENGEYEYEYAK